MNNRNSTSPIFFALTVALAGGFVGWCQADPESGATGITVTNTAPATPPPPAAAAPAPAAPAAETVAPGDRPATYTVVSGDSYWTIAQKFGVSTKKLKKLNNAKNNNLKPGQVLQLPPVKPDAATPAAKPTADVIPTKPKKAKSIAGTNATQPAVTPLPETMSGAAAPAVKATAAVTPAKPKKAKAIAATTTPPPQPKTDTLTDSSASLATTTPSETKTSRHHSKLPLLAQPVQGFDVVAASTFASCPVTPSNADDDAPAVPVATPAPLEPMATKAPVASLVSPEELSEDAPKTAPPVARVAPAPVPKTFASETPSEPTFVARPPSAYNSSSSKLTSRMPALALAPSFETPAGDWGNRFLTEARTLGDRGIEYDENWRPPGEPHSWAMDCSNTSRYLYKVTTGISLPRTASDQYYYLHLQNKAWDVPQTSTGFADCNYLRHNLKAGDLLFWENTYRPERQPPITHVMVFLGTNDKGQWIMAGSQTSRGGEHNRRNGGPDIYVFDPTKPCGGYSTWLGLVRHQGRFCAYGRPLEADKSKLDVAANN